MSAQYENRTMQPNQHKTKATDLKLAFYMTGSFARILRRCVDYLDWEMTAICPNFQSFKEVQKEPRFVSVDYLYAGFNDLFNRVDVEKFCETYASINLSEVLLVDKVHFKKKSGDYQLRYLCAMGERIAEVYRTTRPDYVFFPIIETVDAMLAYRMAQHFRIQTIISSHTRFSPHFFFSHSHLELLPKYTGRVPRSDSDTKWAEQFLASYRANPGPFHWNPNLPPSGVYSDRDHDVGVFRRLLRNIRLKHAEEKHNQLINLWINFQVRFEKLILPLRNAVFYAIERFYIRPRPVPSGGYDFFPLHFSPESSINVLAPFFIDQARVVDKILLERSGNRPLVLKEHPAMYGFRPLAFFSSLKNKPFVSFVSRRAPTIQLIKNASTVYSVTGTVCIEAFFLGVNWVQFGHNYLSEWLKERRERSEPETPLELICDVLSVAGNFTLYSPGRSAAFDQVLFSKANVKRLCDHLQFHVNQSGKLAES